MLEQEGEKQFTFLNPNTEKMGTYFRRPGGDCYKGLYHKVNNKCLTKKILKYGIFEDKYVLATRKHDQTYRQWKSFSNHTDAKIH